MGLSAAGYLRAVFRQSQNRSRRPGAGRNHTRVSDLRNLASPTYYFPPDAVDLSQLHNSEHRTFCEWKGAASYFDLEGASEIVANVGWTYRRPSQLFEPITDYLSFYASRVDACFVEGEQVQAQAGDFYGGWITSNLVGPFKGVPGSRGW